MNTVHDRQESVRISIFQGEDPNALRNIFIGDFLIEGLSDIPAPNEILCRMDLDLDGILRVTATEIITGLSKQTTIERATAALSEFDLARSRTRVRELFEDEEAAAEGDVAAVATGLWTAAKALLSRSRAILDQLPASDREDAITLNERLHLAIEEGRTEEVARLSTEL